MVEQDYLARDADALTFRARVGVQATSGDWSLLAEGEGTAAIVERYNSGLNGKTAYPIVADPETGALSGILEAGRLTALRTAAMSLLAARYLDDPGRTVLSAALAAGYGSDTSLHRAFRRVGLPSPATLRRGPALDRAVAACLERLTAERAR